MAGDNAREPHECPVVLLDCSQQPMSMAGYFLFLPIGMRREAGSYPGMTTEFVDDGFDEGTGLVPV